jgi:Family of unknown function (DUF6544)
MKKPGQQLILAGLGIAAAATGALLSVRARDACAVARLRSWLEQANGLAVARFSPEMVAGLPEPTRRYFQHAIEPGTPLAPMARLEMTGEMRLGREQAWLPLHAHQVLAPPTGFIWEASVGRGAMRFTGADSYATTRGQTTFRFWDLVPVVRASGPDVSRSARGRLAIESIWNPASLLPERGVTWTSLDDQSARATVTIDGEPIPLTLTIGPDGKLRSVTMERWGNLTTDGHHTYIPFGADIFAESIFDGYTVPSCLSVSWWHGTDRSFDFFHALITGATYLA